MCEGARRLAPPAPGLAAELDAGRVPENGPETAAGLGFEIAGTEVGDRLALLALRALLAKGDFEAGRQEILRLEADGRLADPALWADFAGAIAQGAGNVEFLRQAFAARDALARAALPETTATALALRLTGLGFPEEALRYLSESAASEAAALARAEANQASAPAVEDGLFLVPKVIE